VFVLLRDLIERRTGVFFDDGKRGFLADKLSEGVSSLGMTSFLDYYYLLRYDTDAGQHWSRLMDWLAVPETYFWRQSEQFDTLARSSAPAHFAGRSYGPLRIWSAACCSGEEPLSIAMALAEAGFASHPVEIIASDGSPAMLQRARRGSYSERAFRQLPDGLRDKYFRRCADGSWQPDPALSRNIRWTLANLANPSEVAPLAAVDVIFCRNVFIYFSEDAIRSVVKVFSERMPDSGILFLGASEALTRLGVNFELAEIGGSFAYVKGGRRQQAESLRAP
jgi:chemotaxis protein methyltransferase CheR